jgi:hypothetical protein
MKAYGGVDVQSHILLTSALVGGEWSTSRPCHFTPGETSPGTHWIGGWVGRRGGLDDVEKRNFLTLPGLELRPLGRRASSQSLHRLRYPGSSLVSSDWVKPPGKWCPSRDLKRVPTECISQLEAVLKQRDRALQRNRTACSAFKWIQWGASYLLKYKSSCNQHYVLSHIISWLRGAKSSVT